MNTTSLQPPADQSVESLENHLRTLQSLVQSISTIRYQTLPSLIANLQRPIQACDPQASASTSADLNQVRENWKVDSQDLLDGLQTLRKQALNSQDAMKYIRATTQSNPNLASDEKTRAFRDTALINQQTKQDALKASKSRSSLSRRAKATGPMVEQHMLESELRKRKKLRLLKKTRASFPQLAIPASNLQDCVRRINRLDPRSDHLVLVSPNQLLLTDVMRVFLVFKRPPQASRKTPSQPVIERAFCFGLTESPINTFQRSSFGMIRSINRCINYHINQYLRSDRDQNPSNVWLVCSLLSSYKNFFSSEISVVPRTRRGAPEKASNTTTPLLRAHLPPNQPQQQTRGPTNSSKKDKNSKTDSQSFCTWRRWKADPARLIELVADDQPHPAHATSDQQTARPRDCAPDALRLVLRAGHWANSPEIN